MALDFYLAHQQEVSRFIDSTSQSRFVARIAAGSKDPATITKLQTYATANIAAPNRKPIEQAINAIQVRLQTEPRVKAEAAQWLASRPAAAAALAPGTPMPQASVPAAGPVKGQRG
jgi:aminopeptidase N